MTELTIETPQTTVGWFNLGVALQAAEKEEEAIIAYQHGAELNDDLSLRAACCVNLTAIFIARRDIDPAISFAWRAVSLDPTNPVVILAYGSALRFGRKIDEAVRYYRAAIDANPDYHSLWPEIALMRAAQERHEEAMDIVRAHITSYPTESLQYKTMLEVADICLSAVGRKEAPIVAAYGCPDRRETAQMWGDMFQESEAFRRYAPIVCVGDSHAAFFSGVHSFQYLWPEPTPQWLPHMSGHLIASALAYSLDKPNSSQRGLERLQAFLRSKDMVIGATVMLSFGEIDLRNHVVKQASEQSRPVEAIVDDCVRAYTHAVKLTLDAGFKTMIWAPPPSRADAGVYPMMFPTVGSEQERNAATRLFINGMRAAMAPLGVPVISIFDEMIDADLRSDPRFFMDSCHLNMAATPFAIAAFRKALQR